MSIMRFAYSMLLYVLAPLVLLRLALRSMSNAGYRQRWGQRFGFFPTPKLRNALWIHAVSVGEVQAALPLVNALKKHYPDQDLVITTMTPTGSARVSSLFDDAFHVYVPYDLPGAVQRFLGKIKPRLAIIMETELWPNLFHYCHRANIPIIVANARMSERSVQGYLRFPKFSKEILNNVDIIAAQGKKDASRFQRLGKQAQQIRVTGSIKFDSKTPGSLAEQAEVMRRLLGTGRPVWIAASTHDGEDEIMLRVLKALLAAFPNVLLVLVPRHPERFTKVASLCRRQGFTLAIRSKKEVCSADTQVYLADTLGELPVLYAATDVAVVAGSFATIGGHNPLEPAALGVPVIMGPHTHNFEEITQLLVEINGAKQVEDEAELLSILKELLANADLRDQMGGNGRAFVERNRGAVDRLLQIVREQLQLENQN